MYYIRNGLAKHSATTISHKILPFALEEHPYEPQISMQKIAENPSPSWEKK